MRVISLCAGDQVRSSLPLKQAIEIGGEPILQRTARQVYERGHKLSVISKDDLHLVGVILNTPYHFHVAEDRRWTVETFYWTRHLWEDRTVILLGDVFYTEQIMDSIFSVESDLTFFGNTAEVYAIVFNQKEQMQGWLTKTILAVEANECKGTLRNLYQTIHRQPYGGRTKIKDDWHTVFDQTTDFDLPEHKSKALERTRWIEAGLLT
jgi:hypothetical protein